MTGGQTQTAAPRRAAVPWPPRGPALAGGLVLVAWLVIMSANTVSIGFLNPRTIPGILLGTAALVAALGVARGRPLVVGAGVDAGILLLAGVLVMFLPMYTYLPAGDFGWLTLVMALAAAAIGAGELWPAARRALWVLGVAAAVGGLLAVVAIDSAPRIDVWVMLQQSSDGLAHLRNFYAMHWVDSPGWQQYYPYLPVTTLVVAPFRWAFVDARVGLIACIVVSALLLARPWRRDGGRLRPLAALLLFAPGSIGLVEESWTEPVLLVFLVGTFLAVQRGRPGIGALCFALALAAKQHVVVLIPLLAAWPRLGLRRTGYAVAGAIAICLPWFLADPSAFWHGAVRAHVRGAARPDAPELYTIALQHGWSPPAVLLLAVLAAVLVALCWAARRVPRPGHVCLLAAVALLVASLLNKQSFYNQYWLPAELLVVGLCLDVDAVGPESPEGTAHARTAG